MDWGRHQGVGRALALSLLSPQVEYYLVGLGHESVILLLHLLDLLGSFMCLKIKLDHFLIFLSTYTDHGYSGYSCSVLATFH